MRFGRMLKSNKGSSLTLIILIVLVMSSLGVALMSATAYDMRMSAEYSDLNKAYSAAEAGVEQIANILDDKVAAIQESARTTASDDIKNLINESEIDLTVKNADGSINDNKVNTEFQKKYKHNFDTELYNEFINVNDILNLIPIDGNAESKNGTAQLQSAEFDEDKSNVKVTVIGSYNNSKKQLDVTFNLLPETSSTPYQVVVKAPIKRALPGILQKALVAEKNIISAGGNVTINGDVLCFGTVPVDQDGNEDQSAPWYKYGGIIAGMCDDVADNISGTGFDYSIPETNPAAGSIDIEGDAATMAYIHSAYSVFDEGSGVWIPSNITISGNTFARSVKSEQLASYSQLDFKGNVYTTDNLQVDSSGSKITVEKNYYGFVDAGYFLNGQLVPNAPDAESKKDASQYKRTSSLIVNGDSQVYLNSGVYLGGSTFLKNYTYKDDSDNVIPYMTGISALKSSKKLAEAYFPKNIGSSYYLGDGGKYVSKEYTEANTLQKIPMIDGKSDVNGNNSSSLTMAERAIHLAGLWNDPVNPWKSNDVFSKYLNLGNINIAHGADGNLHGFTNGAVLANGQVLTPNDFYDSIGVSHDPNEFLGIQEQCRADFHSAVEPFVDSYTKDGGKLNYTAPVNSIKSYIDISKIAPDMPYFNTKNEFVYYGSGDIILSQIANGNCQINGTDISSNSGIICIDGNIYISDGVNKFNGVIMASGNIVFKGSANIAYNPTVVNELLDNDTNINQLFNLGTISDTDSQAVVKSQRFLQKNIKIIDWKEEQIN